MTKIVYNACFGGFGLSEAACERYRELGGTIKSRFDMDRADPLLVQVVEELGDNVNTRFSDLRIRELEPDTRYRIDEYDGNEAVVTVDEYEWSVA